MITMLQLHTLETTTEDFKSLFEEVLQRILRSLPFVCYIFAEQVRVLVKNYLLEMY